ncbi:MAG: alpha/beta hydrolase fold domain-containing protein [Planctomycetota bacterium]|nr:alpha/beta hydrolase fold domain-containing protein [Planctomycetota bacterium]MDA1180194.1 alpha/beta hydrolase fold domain-containing protein [Planctomycetota bacterium]
MNHSLKMIYCQIASADGATAPVPSLGVTTPTTFRKWRPLSGLANRWFLLFAVCILACLGSLSNGRAQEPKRDLSAHVVRPEHPILIRNEHGPLLCVMIDVALGQTARLKSMEFSLDGTDDLNDIDTVQLLSTGEQESFSPAAPIGEAIAPARRISLPIDRQLIEGRNVFWLSCRLKDSAVLHHQLAATCLSIATSVGSITPREDTANSHQRIGFALRKRREDGVHTYRIPALTTSSKGTLLAVYDIRRRAGGDLQGDIDVGLSRSTTHGQTWEAPRVIMDTGEFGGLPQEQNGCGDPGIIVDQQTGEIFCFALWMNGKPGQHQWVDDGSEPGFEIGKSAQFMMVRSTDDGVTWSPPENLTRQLKQEAWWLLAPAPQAGICLPDGTLVMPVEGRTGRDRLASFATIMISRDHGRSWTVGAPAYSGGNECQAALLDDGSIMLNIRNDHERFRAVSVTKDLGQTWQPHVTSRTTIIEPNCNGSLLSCDYESNGERKHVLLFANPHSQAGRTNHTIQVSFDEGLTWPDSHHWLLDEGKGAGYPSLTRVDRDHIGIVYEGSQAHLVFEKLPLIELLEPTRRHTAREVWQREVSKEGIDYLEQRRQSPPFGESSFDLDGLRSGMAARQLPTVPGVTLSQVHVGDVPCEWVMTPDADPDVRLLYLHGGGFVSGSGANYLPLAAEISRAANCAVLLADYRLAPEHPFPAGLEDCVAAHQWLVANGPSGPAAARATFVAGDSAGGNLTLATLLVLKERKHPLPSGAIAISPATDLTLSSQSLKSVDDPIVSSRTMPEFRSRYLASADPRQPFASPVFGDFRGLPPLLIQTGEHEMLRDDSIRVAKKARADGTSVKLEIWPGMVHVFQVRGLPESREAVQRIGDFVKSKLAPRFLGH